ncbi:class I poly(R)-hydroxyalkanoic acid synthase [Marivivens niveibacter]|uniref:Class I poly(R)-hydroxyalkanoic acid synthase n=1 Tax=Marivivens niveibacter TaxID=1930667 RepID=A0A251WY57_9RHOB|nr:class I poly(R)-hydroxyalkanoic acid synthase [Marivivens niveibacter]OUD09286.1 class I poly(R)-hydroxyalkanoic acid synthase [Marivivens niveibacter]
MTTEELVVNDAGKAELAKFEANMARIEELTQRILAAFSHKKQVPQALQGPGSDLYMKAATAMWAEWLNHPSKIFEQQIEYWGKTLKHFTEAQEGLAKGTFQVPKDETGDDRRFANPLWKTNPYFNFVKQQYMMNAEAIMKGVDDLEGLSELERGRLRYFSGQIVDMMCPTNFLPTNPDALQRAIETEGQSLVDGLENLVRDLEAHDGELVVSLADGTAFQLGNNIATTKGDVVFRNELFELIQYAPTTDQVHKTPLVLFPPWINKFYILDLKEQNSLVKYIVDQGFTLFVVSWVNPDASMADTGLEDYIAKGYRTAINEVKAICGTETVNAVGYCIAGTTLSVTLSQMEQEGDSSVNSATFFTTLTDFSDQGEFRVFLTDDFVDGIEEECNRTGILESFYMARTFSYLRSRDLIYQPAIKSYMMGETPPAFDLLYWNGDGTNLPAKMAVQYLRHLCQKDEFAQGVFELDGMTHSVANVKVPVCAIACETDHIAAWKSSFQGVQKMGSKDKTFILSESGHIAGIVNPPSKKKYGHWTNPDLGLDPEDWKDSADKHEGSWWPRWAKWLSARSGEMVEARKPGDSSHPSLCSAPGTYVQRISL